MLFKNSRTILSGLLLLVIFALLAGTLAAQTDQETKRAAAEKLLSEATQLYKEGAKDSLEQAIQKLEQARPLFHSINEASSEAGTLNNIGKVYSDLGENQKALD